MERKYNPYPTQQQKIDLLLKRTTRIIKPEQTGQCPLDQLNLQYSQSNPQDINDLTTILSKLLTYPSTQLAQIHHRANRLGDLYLKQNETQDPTEYQRRICGENICACCGLTEQKNTLIISTQLGDIRHIGVSTYLYFMTIKNIIALMVIMLVIYSIFALITNILASSEYKKSITDSIVSVSQRSYYGILLLSLGSKQIHETQLDKTYYTVQCWLGVAMVAIWGVAFGFIKYRQRVVSKGIDINLRSAADYTIFIKNLPNNMTKQTLSQQLNAYRVNLMKTYSGQIQKFNQEIQVQKINIAAPYYLQRSELKNQTLDTLNKQYKQYEQIFISWINQRQQNKQFTTSRQDRQARIRQFLQIKKRIDQQYQQISKKIIQQMKARTQRDTLPAFVTLSHSYAKQFLVKAHSDVNSVLNCISCKDDPYRYYSFQDKKTNTLQIAKIRKAPQPEDIIWANQGQDSQTYIKKRVITYGITLILLGTSFAVIYGLSSVQAKQKDSNKSSSQYISILISICISIVNIIINLILRILTNFERISTFSHYQIGLAMKGVIASLINSIAIPILVNYFFKSNLYGENGLAEDVFYLGITNSFITPILTILNPQYLFNWIIRKYKSMPGQKLYLNQNQLNAIYQNLQFQVGYEYIYVINLFLFTCFFVPLQPIIVFFAIFGLIMSYWAKKYSLFARSQKPIPGNNSINTAVYQLIYLGPAFYTIGSFCWSHFFKKQFISIAPNLVSAILSLILFLIPYKKLSKKLFHYEQQQKRIYQKDRIFLPSEYDRLNPLTSEQSIEQYKRFVTQQIQKHKTPQQILAFQNEFMMMRGLGYRNYNKMSVFEQLFDINHTAYDNKNIIGQKFFQNRGSTFNPLFLLNMTLPNNQNYLRMSVQNWNTNNNQRRNTLTGQKHMNGLIAENLLQANNQVLKIGENGLMIATKQLPNELKQNKYNSNNRPKIKYTQQRQIQNYNYNQQSNDIVNGNRNGNGNNIPMNLGMNMFGNLFRKSINAGNENKNIDEQGININLFNGGNYNNNRRYPQVAISQQNLNPNPYNQYNPTFHQPAPRYPGYTHLGAMFNPMPPNNHPAYTNFNQNRYDHRLGRNG